jgi:membrane protease YdiL (CAAX protease family)
MNESPILTTADKKRRVAAWLGVLFALVFPSIVTWAYFFQAATADQGVQQAVMATLKMLQFAFPAAWALLVLRDGIDCRRPTLRGVATGLLFGLAVAVAGWLVLRYVLIGSPMFVAASEQIRTKVASFGIDTVTKYVALAAFYSLAHSLLEEYYWRWFVFGQLRRLVSLWPAIVVSSLGFMAHHVLVLSLYFGWWSWPTLFFSASVAVGGAFWAWLYDRTGSLVGPWLSHLLVDAGIFFIGFQLVRGSLG